MKFSSISDVHIKNADDCPRLDLFLKFLNSNEVSQSNKIFLLGDIFDIFVGNHEEYIDYYSSIFSKLDELSKSGKSIYYIEGNHDFHLKQLMETFAKKNNLKDFYLFEHAIKLRDEKNNKTIYLGHGDEIEIDNWGYRLYTAFIRSLFMKIIVNYFFTFNIVQAIGNWASRKSRNRNEKKYDQVFDTEKIKTKFRKCAELAHGHEIFDIMICGHSHVKDEFTSVNKFEYFNNGYVPIEKSFLFYEDGKVRFVKL